jgi:hypothetical protein
MNDEFGRVWTEVVVANSNISWHSRPTQHSQLCRTPYFIFNTTKKRLCGPATASLNKVWNKIRKGDKKERRNSLQAVSS